MAANGTNRDLIRVTGAATVLQVIMVTLGHFSPAVAMWFGPGGMTISLLAGLGVALAERPAWSRAATRGALSGGVCAFLGIGLSLALGDVLPILLLFGTLSSAVAGALGGLVGIGLRRPSADRAQVGRLNG